MKPIKIMKNLNEAESAEGLQNIKKGIENILKQCSAEISYVDIWSADENVIDLSCKIKADKISKYDNDVSIEGRLYFDENLNLNKSDIKTSSGPNILNYDFIRCLDALYSYFSSGNSHYNL